MWSFSPILYLRQKDRGNTLLYIFVTQNMYCIYISEIPISEPENAYRSISFFLNRRLYSSIPIIAGNDANITKNQSYRVSGAK